MLSSVGIQEEDCEEEEEEEHQVTVTGKCAINLDYR